MTPLCFWIGSLSFGDIRRFLMVVPPLQCTCTPNLIHSMKIFCQCFKNIGRKFGVQVHCKGGTTIKNLLMSPKDKDPIQKQSGVIYSYHCDRVDCDEEYIGESSRTFGERFKEHLKPPSPIFDHSNISGHSVTINNFKFLGERT